MVRRNDALRTVALLARDEANQLANGASRRRRHRQRRTSGDETSVRKLSTVR